MVRVEDMVKIGRPTASTNQSEKQTLLSKYQIPIHCLEFDYVSKCENARELEKILLILRSGEEGFFPDLTKATEERLTQIRPNSKLLKEDCPILNKNQIDKLEWKDLAQDLTDWIDGANNNDQELENNKKKSVDHSTYFDIRRNYDTRKEFNAKSVPKRIATTDYESWDKYDPDTEILKMDLEEEKLHKEALKREQEVKIKSSKTVRFNEFVTETEAIFEANREKERGNECFKANELQNAMHHYTNSLQCKSLPAVYTNRALVYSRLKKYGEAINDCKSALKIEPRNFKAHLRMAQSYKAIASYREALKSVENAIEIDPNNTMAQELANSLRQVFCTTKRLQIEDIESNSAKVQYNEDVSNNKSFKSVLKNKKQHCKDERATLERKENLTNTNNSISKQSKIQRMAEKIPYEIIPIPGTSRMLPPYYKVVYSDNPDVIKREKQKILSRSTMMDLSPNLQHFEFVTAKCGLQICQPKSNIQIEDDLEKFKFNDDDEEKGKGMWITSPNSSIPKLEEITNQQGKGEPFFERQQLIIPSEAELQSPYMFIQTWNSIRKDASYKQHAQVLEKLDFQRIHDVIGYKFDDTMLSAIINCLHRHFMVPGKLHTVYAALTNMIRIPRFKMTLLFLGQSDRAKAMQLMEFLDQHGHNLPANIRDVYCNI